MVGGKYREIRGFSTGAFHQNTAQTHQELFEKGDWRPAVQAVRNVCGIIAYYA